MNAYITLQHPEFVYHRKGFCSIVNQVIDIVYEHYKIFNNLNVFIEDEQILELFDSSNFINNSFYDSSRAWLSCFFNNQLSCKFNAHIIYDKNFLKERNIIFNNVLAVKKTLLEEFELLEKKFIKPNTLGIQIRGTDKKTELPEIPEQMILKKIKNCIEKNDIKNILLCTDDIKYINLLKENFGDMVVYNYSNTVSLDGKPLHFIRDRTNLNKQVLSDVYLLSKCEHFLYCYSNVSYLAATIGINNFKTLELLN